MRATREEIEQRLVDPEWWPQTLDRVRETGGIGEIRDENVWSYGAFIGWIRADEKRAAEYDEALRDYAHREILATIPIADGATSEDVAVANMRIKTRQWAAGKWDRKRYGETVKVDGGAVVVADAGLLLTMGALLERVGGGVRSQPERVVAEVRPALQAYTDIDEI